ncbi:MAG: endolytic transglycosylase MltG [Burkholderiaceae bacterium]
MLSIIMAAVVHGESRVVRKLALILLMVIALTGGAAYVWLESPLTQDHSPVDLVIEPGSSAAQVARLVQQSGVQVRPELLYLWFRVSGDSRNLKAGSYEISAGSRPRDLLRKLVSGEQALRSLTLVEGWTFRQVRQALATAPNLMAQSTTLSDARLMEQLGRPGLHPEGRFFPDTYSYPKNSTDLQLLARAMRAMDRQLQAAWERRATDSPLKTPEQALILGSIVEKETARPGDRPMIAGVFTNRLRQGMLLQTDPTVIYGLGPSFDGNLRKKDLSTDTPWNTYTRAGLPPTPIAMPGKDALLAAVAPAATDALYFVARGDGTSQFSNNLAAHNRAVNQFQRKP